MNESVANLAPSEIWTWFERLNAVPRPSKKEERVIEFIKGVGQELGLETIVDSIGNVVIRKPATAGKESCTPVVMQAHLDMVHQKNADVDFDFLSQGIESRIDGDWVKANGTTLGADNGMGVASILAVLASNDIAHGPLEGLFTIDEETGMTGALKLSPDLLQGKMLLNTDTEDEGELTIGCAGGIDSTFSLDCELNSATPGTPMEIAVTGLAGGHSGCEIHLGRGNANLIMNRIFQACMQQTDFGLEVASLNGGSLRNAIPRESFALLNVTGDVKAFTNTVAAIADEIKSEFADADNGLSIVCKESDKGTEKVLPAEILDKLVASIAGAPAGVIGMSQTVDGLVETSTNLAKVTIGPTGVAVDFLSRSSVESEKTKVTHDIEAVFKSLGGKTVHSGDYPGWEPNADSALLQTMKKTYAELFGKQPTVNAVHAGLECGIIGSHYPAMDMVSFGPTIRNPHSPDEKCHIPSVSKYWDYLRELLGRIE